MTKIIPQYSTFLLNEGVNYCIIEYDFPKLTALNVGCKVMLLKNYPSKYKVVNSSIGIVKNHNLNIVIDLDIFYMNFLYVLLSNLKKVTFLKKPNGELIYTKKIFQSLL